ncbi:TonB-dependent receptor domain-containing protein [Thauera mechernichensis]|uniref:TonB-dependent receptor domain-containing protein n=1 Tax=Thauera mechernichensis TaxID=82788 RepID=A0ABW3WFU8_9RHOO|nr:TonB-dependent receptor [Thauera mechernichensis]MDG3064997.1 TonB-dependent receptor [Thauera mechernichensis]
MRPRHSNTPIVQRTLLSLAVAMVVTGVFPESVHADVTASSAATARKKYDIGPGSLESTLNRFGREAGILLAFPSDLVADLNSAGLRGTYSPQEGLDRLLEGSGLEGFRDSGGKYGLRRTARAQRAGGTEATLEAVRVTAGFADSTATPGRVSARTLERYAANDLEDILAGQPEVSVGGGHGIAQKIFVRGVEDTLVSVSIDGTVQGNRAFHHAGRLQLEPELISRVEIMPGVVDATAGPGALGGAIRFITKDPEELLRRDEKAGALVKGEYTGNAEGYKAHTTVFGRLGGNWSAMASMTRLDQSDYEDGSGERVHSTGSQQESSFFKVVGKLTTEQTLRVTYDRHDNEGMRNQRPQWIRSSWNPAYPMSSERRTWNAGYTWKSDNPLLDLAANLYQTQTDFEQNVIGRWGVYVAQMESTGFDMRNTSVLGRHRVTYGFDYRRDKVNAGSLSNLNEETGNGDVRGFFVQDRIQLADPLHMDIGVRHDRYEVTDDSGTTMKASGFSPNVGFTYALTPELILLAAHSRALRGPGNMDAFKMSVATNAPGLKAEKARSSELGAEYERDRLRLGAKVYETLIDNAIADPLGRPNRYENVGQLKSRGLLLTAGYQWNRLTMAVNFHRNLLTLNDEVPNGYAHNGLGISQGNTVTASLDYTPNDRLEMGWQGRFVRGIDSQSTVVGTIGKPGYGVHDLYARWHPSGRDNYTVSLSVRNVFDKSYLDHATTEDFQHIPGYEGVVGSREPGRELRIGLSARF